MHTDYSTLIESNSIVDDWMILNLRITFGGKAGPSKFCVMSDVTTDLATDIANHKYFSPGLFQVNNRNLITERKDSLEATIEQALEMSPEFGGLEEELISNDCYIDDDISLAVDIDDSVEKIVDASMLAIQAVARPLQQAEIIPSKDMLSILKLKAEGTPSTRQIVLGWEIDTNKLTIGLPEEKANAWRKQAEEAKITGQIDAKDLESLVGKLTHIAAA